MLRSYVGTALAAVSLFICFTTFANQAHIEQMLDEIQSMAKYSVDYTGIEAIDDSVMDVLRTVDRKLFVPVESRQFAFENRPLGIGHGQTISQPFIVALMTHVLEIEDSDKVLEIGTGSGYQAAVLAGLAEYVYTIEIVESLAMEASERLSELSYDNVSVKQGDGWFGWSEHAPYDKIMITAVAPQIPPELVDQLKIGGTMVLPVGAYDGYQELVVIRKTTTNETQQKTILPVRFVPMTGEAARQ